MSEQEILTFPDQKSKGNYPIGIHQTKYDERCETCGNYECGKTRIENGTITVGVCFTCTTADYTDGRKGFPSNWTPRKEKKKEENQERDQRAKADAGKPRLTLVPTQILYDIAAVREFAVNTKYKDPDNWKQVEIERFRDALFRHLLLYLNNPKGLDEESGLPHLSHVATNVAFLCELEKLTADKERMEINGH